MKKFIVFGPAILLKAFLEVAHMNSWYLLNSENLASPEAPHNLDSRYILFSANVTGSGSTTYRIIDNTKGAKGTVEYYHLGKEWDDATKHLLGLTDEVKAKGEAPTTEIELLVSDVYSTTSTGKTIIYIPELIKFLGVAADSVLLSVESRS